MNNQIQQTYARTTSSGSADAQPHFLEQASMADNEKPAVVFLRGLKARCQWAVAHLSAEEFECAEAQTEAYCDGRFDFDIGRDCADVPPLLADVTELRRAWLRGWDEACEAQELASCPYCQDPDVDLCPIHDYETYATGERRAHQLLYPAQLRSIRTDARSVPSRRNPVH